jgi:DNA-binding transcriptional regulator YhcF (GntR family)
VEISIQREASISIHQQLVTQIALQIASGILAEGTRLPSVRGLSQRLGIHYNTCLSVYKELAALNLVEARKGSGMVVARFQGEASAQALETRELQQMVKYFVRTVLQKGYSWEEVEQALSLARTQLAATSVEIVFVDIHTDILPVFQAELTQALGQPVRVSTLQELVPDETSEQTRYLVSRYHYKLLKDRLGSDEHILVIDVGTGREEMALLKSLPEGAFVTIISHSRVILDMAESVVSGLRGHTLLTRTVCTDEGPVEIAAALSHAQWVICDFLSEQLLGEQLKSRRSVMRLIPEAETARIREALKLLD